jgi:hypothetical protein
MDGLGFGMKWNMGWMHDTLAYMKERPGQPQVPPGPADVLAGVCLHENFVLPLSHDEVVHGKGSLINKMPGDDWQQFANLRAPTASCGRTRARSCCSWAASSASAASGRTTASSTGGCASRKAHGGMQRLVAQLNRVYRAAPALHQLDFSSLGLRMGGADDAEASVFAFLRKAADGSPPLLVVSNMTPVPRTNYLLGVPLAGHWREVINTDATGVRRLGWGNFGGVDQRRPCAHGHRQSVCITLPPLVHADPGAPMPLMKNIFSTRPPPAVAQRCPPAAAMVALPEDGAMRAVIDAVLPWVDNGRFAVKCVAGERVGACPLLHRWPRRAARAAVLARARASTFPRSADEAATQRRVGGRVLPPALGRYATPWPPGSTPSSRGACELTRRVDPPTCASPRRSGALEIAAAAACRGRRPQGAARAGPPSSMPRRPVPGRRRGRRSRRWRSTTNTPTWCAAIPTAGTVPCATRSNCRWWPTASARASAPGTNSFRARPRRARRARHLQGRGGAPAGHVPQMGFDVLYCRRSTRSAACSARAEQRARRRPRDVGSPWAIGAAEGGHKSILPALGTAGRLSPPARQGRRARPGDRARHRLPVRARPPLREGAPRLVPLAPRRHRAVRREPAQEVPGHLPLQLRVRGLARRCGPSSRACSTTGSGRACASSASTTRTPRPFRSGSGHRRGQARAPRGDLPGRGLHAAEGDAPARQAGLLAVVHLLHLAQRQSGAEEYFTELSSGPGIDYFRPNAWPNTPDILHEQLQTGEPRRVHDAARAGRHAQRPTTASTARPTSCAAPAARPGSEEYLDSEKYQLRHWNHDAPTACAPSSRG